VFAPSATVTVVRAFSDTGAAVAPGRCRGAGYKNRSSSEFGSYLFATPDRSPVGEWHVLHFPVPLQYSRPALALPVFTFSSLYSRRFTAAWVRARRNAARSEICAFV